MIRSTCFGHYYAHHQELATIQMDPPCGTSPWLWQVAGLVHGCRFNRPGRGMLHDITKVAAAFCNFEKAPKNKLVPHVSCNNSINTLYYLFRALFNQISHTNRPNKQYGNVSLYLKFKTQYLQHLSTLFESSSGRKHINSICMELQLASTIFKKSHLFQVH
jgi:hypothetical protein